MKTFLMYVGACAYAATAVVLLALRVIEVGGWEFMLLLLLVVGAAAAIVYDASRA